MNNDIFLFLYNSTRGSSILEALVVFSAHTLPYLVVIGTFIFLVFYQDEKKNPPDQAYLNRYSSGWMISVIRARWKEFFVVFFSGLLAWILSSVLKIIFAISRPAIALSDINPLIHESSYAFPSGHSAFFMALAFAVYFKHKKSGYVLLSLAFLIGVARIFAGVHFPVDIIGGFVLGYIVAFFVNDIM